MAKRGRSFEQQADFLSPCSLPQASADRSTHDAGFAALVGKAFMSDYLSLVGQAFLVGEVEEDRYLKSIFRFFRLPDRILRWQHMQPGPPGQRRRPLKPQAAGRRLRRASGREKKNDRQLPLPCVCCPCCLRGRHVGLTLDAGVLFRHIRCLSVCKDFGQNPERCVALDLFEHPTISNQPNIECPPKDPPSRTFKTKTTQKTSPVWLCFRRVDPKRVMSSRFLCSGNNLERGATSNGGCIALGSADKDFLWEWM